MDIQDYYDYAANKGNWRSNTTIELQPGSPPNLSFLEAIMIIKGGMANLLKFLCPKCHAKLPLSLLFRTIPLSKYCCYSCQSRFKWNIYRKLAYAICILVLPTYGVILRDVIHVRDKEHPVLHFGITYILMGIISYVVIPFFLPNPLSIDDDK